MSFFVNNKCIYRYECSSKSIMSISSDKINWYLEISVTAYVTQKPLWSPLVTNHTSVYYCGYSSLLTTEESVGFHLEANESKYSVSVSS